VGTLPLYDTSIRSCITGAGPFGTGCGGGGSCASAAQQKIAETADILKKINESVLTLKLSDEDFAD
jgi:hypothetical protein